MTKINSVVGERQVRICNSCDAPERHTSCGTTRPNKITDARDRVGSLNQESLVDNEGCAAIRLVINPNLFSAIEDKLSRYNAFTKSETPEVVTLLSESEIANYYSFNKSTNVADAVKKSLDKTKIIISNSVVDEDGNGTDSNDSVDLQDALDRSRELADTTAKLASQARLLLESTSTKPKNGGLILYDKTEAQVLKKLETVSIQDIPVEVGPWIQGGEKLPDLRSCLYMFC